MLGDKRLRDEESDRGRASTQILPSRSRDLAVKLKNVLWRPALGRLVGPARPHTGVEGRQEAPRSPPTSPTSAGLAYTLNPASHRHFRRLARRRPAASASHWRGVAKTAIGQRQSQSRSTFLREPLLRFRRGSVTSSKVCVTRPQEDGCFAIGLNAQWAGRRVCVALSPGQDGCVYSAALVAFGGPPWAPAPGSLCLQPEAKEKFRNRETRSEPLVRARTRGLQRAPSPGLGAAVHTPGRSRARPGAPQGGAAAGRPAGDRECACAGQRPGPERFAYWLFTLQTNGLARHSPAGGVLSLEV